METAMDMLEKMGIGANNVKTQKELEAVLKRYNVSIVELKKYIEIDEESIEDLYNVISSDVNILEYLTPEITTDSYRDIIRAVENNLNVKEFLKHCTYDTDFTHRIIHSTLLFESDMGEDLLNTITDVVKEDVIKRILVKNTSLKEDAILITDSTVRLASLALQFGNLTDFLAGCEDLLEDTKYSAAIRQVWVLSQRGYNLTKTNLCEWVTFCAEFSRKILWSCSTMTFFNHVLIHTIFEMGKERDEQLTKLPSQKDYVIMQPSDFNWPGVN